VVRQESLASRLLPQSYTVSSSALEKLACPGVTPENRPLTQKVKQGQYDTGGRVKGKVKGT